MIEFIVLAAAVSVELEPYAVENPQTARSGVGTNNALDGRAFQWTTRRNQSGNTLPDSGNLDNFGNREDRDGSEGSVEIGE